MNKQKATANVPSTSEKVQQAAAGIVKSGIADNVTHWMTLPGPPKEATP